MKSIVIISAAWLSLLASAHADVVPPCTAPVGVTAVSVPDGMAPAIQSALHAKLGEIALPGQPFDATDNVITGINRRFIFAWKNGTRWLVATEHGGRGYNNPIFLFSLGEDGKTASLLDTRISFPSQVCMAASSMIGG